ncbi:MAG: FtsX-like permease family protein [Proteobacteria bacterium]|nr:FtsX-like permease family protein [Pseudomonadota bacterium]
MHSDLSFDSDASRHFVPLIVAVMVYLATLALAGSMSVGGTVDRWRDDVRGSMTVQLPGRPGGQTSPEAVANIKAVTDALLATPGVASAAPLPVSDIQALLEPWLGDADLTADLPVPVLIDVTLDDGVSLDPKGLAQRLAVIVPGVQVNDNGASLERLVRLARSVQWVAGIIVALVGGAATAIIVFATRAGMSAHRKTIELLHLIGAHDSYIARQFQFRLLVLSLIGGVLGLVFGAVTLIVLTILSSQVQASLVPRLSLTASHWAILAMLPILGTAVATVTARMTVSRSLRQTL